jgi:hypothetical protein
MTVGTETSPSSATRVTVAVPQHLEHRNLHRGEPLAQPYP